MKVPTHTKFFRLLGRNSHILGTKYPNDSDPLFTVLVGLAAISGWCGLLFV